MADALTTFTEFIVKPSAPFAAGVVLFGAVWGFFKGVEGVLTDDTKLEIAVWLLGVKTEEKVHTWPDTFASVFDRTFGSKCLSWNFFGRSALATGIVVSGFYSLSWVVLGVLPSVADLQIIVFIILGNILPDYISILIARFSLGLLKHLGSGLRHTILLLPVLSAGLLAIAGAYVGATLFEALVPQDLTTFLPEKLFVAFGSLCASACSALFTSIWLWLYAGSGFLLKAARHFDFGFQWFNSKADIEKKPLSALGLVAGALVAVVYWTVVIVSRIV